MALTTTFARCAAVALCAAAALCVAALGDAAQAQMGKRGTGPINQEEGSAARAKREADADQRYKQEKTYPTKTTWSLKSLNNKPVPRDADITLMIDDNFRGTGFAGCNYWSATIYPMRGQRLASGPVATTRKQCPPAVMQLERAFLVGVHSGPEWDLVGPELVLKTKGATLRFERAL